MNDCSRDLRKDNNIFKYFLEHTVDKERLLLQVQKIQSSITIAIVSGMYSGADIEIAVRVLDLYNDANEAKPAK